MDGQQTAQIQPVRSEHDELRILRRVVASKNAKLITEPFARVRAVKKGVQSTISIRLALIDVPAPDSFLQKDITELVSIANRHAEERKKQMNYKNVLSVDFDGKIWIATFEV